MSIHKPEGGWVFTRVTTHPGEMLREEWMVPLKLSAASVAERLKMPVEQLQAILDEEKAVTAEIALRLSRGIGMSAEFWMNLQLSYDLTKAQLELGTDITTSIEPLTFNKAA